MSLNALNDKKTRQLSEQVGIEFDRALVYQDRVTVHARTPGDVHYIVNRRTGEAELDQDFRHFSSCKELNEAASRKASELIGKIERREPLTDDELRRLGK